MSENKNIFRENFGKILISSVIIFLLIFSSAVGFQGLSITIEVNLIRVQEPKQYYNVKPKKLQKSIANVQNNCNI
jgi:hypothetical protein